MDVELRTPRLLLREVRIEDAADIHAYASDPIVCEHMVWGPNESLAETVRVENVGSARVLEKSGMQLEGRMRDHMWIRGSYRDSLSYAALRTDASWRAIVNT